MYRYLDRPVGTLAEPDRFLLAAVRQWVHAAATGRCACAVIRSGFERRGVAGAARDFAMAMAALHVDGIAAIKLGRPCHAVVTEDEARLLAALAAAAAPDADTLLGRIAPTFVTADAVPRFSAALRFVGQALAQEVRP